MTKAGQGEELAWRSEVELVELVLDQRGDFFQRRMDGDLGCGRVDFMLEPRQKSSFVDASEQDHTGG